MNKLRRRRQRARARERLDNICPPCRVCGKTDEIICWNPRQRRLTICPECCRKVDRHHDGESGHRYEREPGTSEHFCAYCGVPADEEWLADQAAAW